MDPIAKPAPEAGQLTATGALVEQDGFTALLLGTVGKRVPYLFKLGSPQGARRALDQGMCQHEAQLILTISDPQLGPAWWQLDPAGDLPGGWRRGAWARGVFHDSSVTARMIGLKAWRGVQVVNVYAYPFWQK